MRLHFRAPGGWENWTADEGRGRVCDDTNVRGLFSRGSPLVLKGSHTWSISSGSTSYWRRRQLGFVVRSKGGLIDHGKG
jgi:hypothetical protein